MLAVAVMALIAIVGVMAVVHILLPENGLAWDAQGLGRMAGALVYWVLMGLLAFGFTVLTRNGIIPMAVLVANSSAVTVTYLLAQNIPAANYLPDMAGVRMFTNVDTSVDIAPVTGGLIMFAWVAVLMCVATWVFSRRDA